MVNIEQEDDVLIVAIPINEANLVSLQALRDLVEALDGEPEGHYVRIDSDEIRYEAGLYGSSHDLLR